MKKFKTNLYQEIVKQIKNFKDSPLENLCYLINVVGFLMAIVGGIVSYVIFITNGVYAEHVAILKENGIGNMKEAFTSGTVSYFTKGIPGSIALLLVLTNLILSIIICVKNSGIAKKIAMFVALSLFGVTGIFFFFYFLAASGFFGHNYNSDNIFIQLYNKTSNMETFLIVFTCILLASIILQIILLCCTYETKGIFINTLYMAIAYFIAIPLIILFLENIIPLVAGAVYIIIIVAILLVIGFVLLSGASEGGSSGVSSGSSGSSKGGGASSSEPKPAAPKPRDRVVKEKNRAFVPKGLKVVRVKGFTHDYVATENFVGMTYELCSVEELEKGKFHIFDTDSGREITKYEIPWQK